LLGVSHPARGTQGPPLPLAFASGCMIAPMGRHASFASCSPTLTTPSWSPTRFRRCPTCGWQVGMKAGSAFVHVPVPVPMIAYPAALLRPLPHAHCLTHVHASRSLCCCMVWLWVSRERGGGFQCAGGSVHRSAAAGHAHCASAAQYQPSGAGGGLPGLAKSCSPASGAHLQHHLGGQGGRRVPRAPHLPVSHHGARPLVPTSARWVTSPPARGRRFSVEMDGGWWVLVE
jgi:hypothetical protein